MNMIERIPTLEGRTAKRWLRILCESVLAVGGALAVTGLIDLFHLYPRIPNISILYLLVILGLASTSGLFAAVLASLTAFLSFDYFLVPPLYMFSINHWEEWIALFIFLATALLTSQLTVVMRERATLAQRHERETRILYELTRLTNSQEHFEVLLELVVESLIRVFASWGVRACGVLFTDASGTLTLPIEASLENTGVNLTPEQRMMAVAAMTKGCMLEMRIPPCPDYQDTVSRISQYSTIGAITILRFLPLKAADQVLGVLCLRIQHPVAWFSSIERMQQDQDASTSRMDIFWTFLEQTTSILERAHLHVTARSGTE